VAKKRLIEKLIIQIPCYNEENALPVALKALPKTIPGVNKVEVLIINDGSTDKTIEVAKSLGVDHIVDLAVNQGLARAFMAGLKESVRQGADIVVNTDADNQYCADDIPSLIQPIIDGQADFVVGARPIMTTEHFSVTKKLLQKLGSWVVRIVSGTNVPDAPSGFRAMSRNAAKQLRVFNDYTYTMETLIQAGRMGIKTTWVPIRTNADLRPSRLVRSIPSYIKRSMITIFRFFVIYKPVRFFFLVGSVFFSAGFLLGLRFLYFYFSSSDPTGKVQSVIFAGTLMVIGMLFYVTALLGDLIAVNRKLLEDIHRRLWDIEEGLMNRGGRS
jgi:glycosyltransferase involved in cell wall biosynthesis